MALCYYKEKNDKDASGWVYLKDVTKISEGGKGRNAGHVIYLHSLSKTMILEAQCERDYSMWLNALTKYCLLADTRTIKCEFFNLLIDTSICHVITILIKKAVSLIDKSNSLKLSVDSSSMKKDGSMFSRNADTPKSTFNEFQFKDLDADEVQSDGSASNHSGNNIHYPDSEKDRNQRKSKESKEVSNRHENYREDHRKGSSGYRGIGGDSGATSRLHKFISKEDAANNRRENSYQNDSENINPTNNNEMVDIADRYRYSLRTNIDEKEVTDEERRAENSSGRHSDKPNSDEPLNNNSDGDDEIEEIKDRKCNKFRQRRRIDMDESYESSDFDTSVDASPVRPKVETTKSESKPSQPTDEIEAKPIKKMKAPPSIAPPRKAKDGLAEIEALRSSNPRMSVDDLISRQKFSANADSKFNDDDEDGQIDLKVPFCQLYAFLNHRINLI